jgi:hypothetical protein
MRRDKESQTVLGGRRAPTLDFVSKTKRWKIKESNFRTEKEWVQ